MWSVWRVNVSMYKSVSQKCQECQCGLHLLFWASQINRAQFEVLPAVESAQICGWYIEVDILWSIMDFMRHLVGCVGDTFHLMDIWWIFGWYLTDILRTLAQICGWVGEIFASKRTTVVSCCGTRFRLGIGTWPSWTEWSDTIVWVNGGVGPANCLQKIPKMSTTYFSVNLSS